MVDAKPPPPSAPKPPDNRDQDPRHPANVTPSAPVQPMPRSPAEGFGIPPDQLRTAQEADDTSEVPGVGPVSPAEVSPGPVETIQDQGIGPRTPYPTGDPPPPSETTIRGQGIKGATDKPVVKPDETKGPAPRPAAPPPPNKPPVR
jgi:hypothetical protein